MAGDAMKRIDADILALIGWSLAGGIIYALFLWALVVVSR